MTHVILHQPNDPVAKIIAEELRIVHGLVAQEFEGSQAPETACALVLVQPKVRGSCLAIRQEGAATGSLPRLHVIQRGETLPEGVELPAWCRSAKTVYAVEVNVQHICTHFAHRIADNVSGRAPEPLRRPYEMT